MAQNLLKHSRTSIPQRVREHAETGIQGPVARGWKDAPARAYARAVFIGRRRKRSARRSARAVAMRSGARRSQEQGESRMTVVPGARNLGIGRRACNTP